MVSSPVLRDHGVRAGIGEHETAGAVGALDHARRKTGLADGRPPAGRRRRRRSSMAPPRMSASVAPKSAALSRTSGSRARGTPSRLSSSSSQSWRRMSNSKVREALVASVAWTLPAGQAPDQEAVDGAEGQLALRSARAARARDVVQQPGDLGAGEVGIDHQAGLVADRDGPGRPRRSSAQAVGGAPVLPDDGAVDRPTALAVPDQRRLALVGDADARRSRTAPAWPRSSASRVTATVECHRSSGSCSTQPSAGKICGNSSGPCVDRVGPRIEQHGAAARRALVDGTGCGRLGSSAASASAANYRM